MYLPWDTFKRVTPAVRPDIDSAPDIQTQGQSLALKPVIVGAGLAGCWLARTLAERGVSVNLIDQHDSAACGASGNPAGIVKPFVTRAPCDAMQFYTLAHQHLCEQLKTLNLTATGFHPCGVSQLVHRAYPASEQYKSLNVAQTDQSIGHNVQSQSIYFANSGWLNPNALCQSLIEHPLIKLYLSHEVTSASRAHASDNTPIWTLNFENRQKLDCRHLILASGDSLSMLPETRNLPIVPARGQLSRFEIDSSDAAPLCVVSGKHYVIPDGKTILVGASFDRGNKNTAVLEHEHAQNRAGLEALLPMLSINPIALDGYAGVRATTPDRLPLIGPMHDQEPCKIAYAHLRHGKPEKQFAPLPTIDGLYVLGGYGSRGIITAPFGAKLLADHLMNNDGLNEWASLVNPARFLIRQLRRGITGI